MKNFTNDEIEARISTKIPEHSDKNPIPQGDDPNHYLQAEELNIIVKFLDENTAIVKELMKNSNELGFSVENYIQLYNSDEEFQIFYDEGLSSKIYFNPATEVIRIGLLDSDGFKEYNFSEIHKIPQLKSALDNEIVERARVDALKLNKPTQNATNQYVILGDGSTTPKGDLGKNFANTDLVVTSNRKHTGTASVEFGMPFICSNPSVRYSGLVNKSTDATFNRVLVTDSQGQVNYTDLLTSEFLRYENNGKVGFGLKLRRDNPNGYFPIGKDAIDLSISRSNTMYAGASGDSSVAIGNIAKASANFSIAIGENTNATQNYSVAIGYQSSANGNYSVAIGSYSTIAKGANSTAIGPASIAENTDAIAVGKQAVAKGVRSVAVGLHTNSNSEYSFSFGFSLEASTYKSFVIGFDNPTKIGQSTTAWIPTDDLFVVGNGGATIGSKSEALNIKKNGHATLPSVNDTMIDTDIKSVITKEYLDIRIPKPPTTGNFVLKSVDGLVSWVTN